MHLSLLEILATFMVLFAIIDILGSIPIILDVKAKTSSITTLLSLRAEYHFVNILVALSLNMIIVYLVLRLITFFERILGPNGLHILRKFLILSSWPSPLSYSYQTRGLRYLNNWI